MKEKYYKMLSMLAVILMLLSCLWLANGQAYGQSIVAIRKHSTSKIDCEVRRSILLQLNEHHAFMRQYCAVYESIDSRNESWKCEGYFTESESKKMGAMLKQLCAVHKAFNLWNGGHEDIGNIERRLEALRLSEQEWSHHVK